MQPLPLCPKIIDPIVAATEGEIESSESDDEEFEWYSDETMQDDTYFCLTNMNRATMKKGEEAFNCYGNRCNRYLLIDYGFAFANNHYDSVELYMNMGSEPRKL